MQPKISILLPSIRPQNLIKYFEAAKKASETNDFEIVIVSPYKIPDELLKDPRIQYIHSYCNPNVALAQAAANARGEFLLNSTDDGLLQENVLDIAYDIFINKFRDIDILNLQYLEDVLDFDTLELKKEPIPFHPNYWLAGIYPEYQKPAINPNWRLAPHFFMKREYFEKLGGLDMRFTYNNHSLHDVLFRAQYNGSRVFDFPYPAFYVSHAPGETKDHKPVNDAQIFHDTPIFNELYSKEDAISSRVFLNINDWKNYPKVWDRRFSDIKNLPLNV